MKKITFSIRTKVILLTLFPLLLGGIILEGLLYLNMPTLLLEKGVFTLKEDAQYYKEHFIQNLQPIKTQFLTLAAESSQQLNQDKVSQADLNKILEDFLRTHPDYISARFISENKKIPSVSLYRTDEYTLNTLHGKNLPVEKDTLFLNHAAQLKKNQLDLSKFFFTQSQLKTTPELIPAFQLATPIFNQKNQKIGLLISSINAKKLLTDVASQNNLRNAVFFTDHQGSYLVFLNNAITALPHKVQDDFPETQSLFIQKNLATETMSLANIDTHYNYTFFSKIYYAENNKEAFVGLILTVKKDVIYQQVKKSLYQLIAGSSLLILLIILIIYAGIKKLINPLQELVFASNNLGSDLSTLNFPTDSNDELAALAQSLERMNRTIIKQNDSLKNSALMNKSIMNNISDALITINIEGEIDFFNVAAEKLFGYSAEEIRGKNVSILMPEPYKSKHNDYLKHYLAGNDSKIIANRKSVEVIGIRKNESLFPMELSITEMVLKHRKLEDKKYFIGLCRDIEARKKAEQSLKKAEQIATIARKEAEKANNAKTQFLSKMSHEFKTPLNAILGFAQIELLDDNPEIDKSYLQAIYDSGNHLLSMVNDILDLSSIETGEINLTSETISVIEFIQEIYNGFLVLCNENQLKIELLLPEIKEILLIKADKARLKQVLMNLVSNAIKFNRKNGTVSIAVKKIQTEIEFSISDQGDGISENKLDLIFKPFERLNAYEKGIDGLGIGLMIAKQLTESMQGTIGVESVISEGSQFYIRFPLIENVQKNAAQSSEVSEDIIFPNDKTVSILYIDADNINMLFIKKILEKYKNIEFIPANSSVMGINVVRKKVPDLVLLNMQLPDIDGFEVFECLKNYPAMKDIPIIGISASSIQDDLIKAMSLGFYAYLIKPINTFELYKKISQALFKNYTQR